MKTVNHIKIFVFFSFLIIVICINGYGVEISNDGTDFLSFINLYYSNNNIPNTQSVSNIPSSLLITSYQITKETLFSKLEEQNISITEKHNKTSYPFILNSFPQINELSQETMDYMINSTKSELITFTSLNELSSYPTEHYINSSGFNTLVSYINHSAVLYYTSEPHSYLTSKYKLSTFSQISELDKAVLSHTTNSSTYLIKVLLINDTKLSSDFISHSTNSSGRILTLFDTYDQLTTASARHSGNSSKNIIHIYDELEFLTKRIYGWLNVTGLVNVTIMNKGTTYLNITEISSNLSWFKINHSLPSLLLPSEQRNFRFALNLPEDIDEGDYVAGLSIKLDKGVVFNTTLTITISDVAKTFGITPGLIEQNMSIGQTKLIKLRLKNHDYIPINLFLNVSHSSYDWLYLDSGLPYQWFTLSAGENKEVTVTITIPNNCSYNPEMYTFDISVFREVRHDIIHSSMLRINLNSGPIISDILPRDNILSGSDDILFNWRTNINSTSELFLKELSESGFSYFTNGYSPKHKIDLYNLPRNKNYSYFVKSSSACGTTNSSIRTFYIDNGIVFKSKFYNFTLKRYYDQQNETISVKNTDSIPHQLLVELKNNYDDLAIGFVGNGSMDKIISLLPGETRNLYLVVHTQDTLAESYEIPIMLTTIGDENITDNAVIHLNVVEPIVDLEISTISSDPNTLVRKMTIRNNGDPITDLTVKGDSSIDSYILMQPSIKHTKFEPGDSIKFYVTPLFSSEKSSLEGSLIAEGYGKSFSTPISFICSEGRSPITASIPYVDLCFNLEDWYCTNKEHIEREVDTPSGFGEEDVNSIELSIDFNLPWSASSYRNHDVYIKINGNTVGSILNSIPSGRYVFNVNPSYLNYARAGNAKNIISIETMHMNGGHYVVATELMLKISLKKLGATVCATDYQDAMEVIKLVYSHFICGIEECGVTITPGSWKGEEVKVCSKTNKTFTITNDCPESIVLNGISGPSYMSFSGFVNGVLAPNSFIDFTATVDGTLFSPLHIGGIISGEIVVDIEEKERILPYSLVVGDLRLLHEAALLRASYDTTTSDVRFKTSDMFAIGVIKTASLGLGEVIGKVYEFLKTAAADKFTEDALTFFEYVTKGVFKKLGKETTEYVCETDVRSCIRDEFYEYLLNNNYLGGKRDIENSVKRLDAFSKNICQNGLTVDEDGAINYIKRRKSIIGNIPNIPTLKVMEKYVDVDLMWIGPFIPSGGSYIVSRSFNGVYSDANFVYQFEDAISYAILIGVLVILALIIILGFLAGLATLPAAAIVKTALLTAGKWLLNVLALAAKEKIISATLVLISVLGGMLGFVMPPLLYDQFEIPLTDIENGHIPSFVRDPEGPYVTQLYAINPMLYQNSTFIIDFVNSYPYPLNSTAIVIIKSSIGEFLGEVSSNPIIVDGTSTYSFELPFYNLNPGTYFLSGIVVYNETLSTPPVTSKFIITQPDFYITDILTGKNNYLINETINSTIEIYSDSDFDNLLIWSKLLFNSSVVISDLTTTSIYTGINDISIVFPGENITSQGIHNIEVVLFYNGLNYKDDYVKSVIVGTGNFTGMIINDINTKEDYDGNEIISFNLTVTNAGLSELSEIEIDSVLMDTKSEIISANISILEHMAQNEKTTLHITFPNTDNIPAGIYLINISLKDNIKLYDHKIIRISKIGIGKLFVNTKTDKVIYYYENMSNETIKITSMVTDEFGFIVDNCSVKGKVISPNQEIISDLPFTYINNTFVSYFNLFNQANNGTFMVRSYSIKPYYSSQISEDYFVVEKPSKIDINIITDESEFYAGDNVIVYINVSTNNKLIDSLLHGFVIYPNGSNEFLFVYNVGPGKYKTLLMNVSLIGTYNVTIESWKLYFENDADSVLFDVNEKVDLNRQVNISLKEGWNLISIPLNLTNRTLPKPLESIEGNYSKIFTYNGRWIELENDSEINETKGYWIKSLKNQTLTIEGTEFNYPVNIPLKQGWNLIGYPYVTGTNINNSDLKNYTVFTYMNNSWLSYNPSRTNSLNTLKSLIPSYGYWVKSN